jgi:hypothetical protein
MKLQIAELKTERQWRAATGFDQARFEKLLVVMKIVAFVIQAKRTLTGVAASARSGAM